MGVQYLLSGPYGGSMSLSGLQVFVLLIAVVMPWCIAAPQVAHVPLNNAAAAPVQLQPLPLNAFELSTGPTLQVDTPENRGPVVALMQRVGQNSDLHIRGSEPF